MRAPFAALLVLLALAPVAGAKIAVSAPSPSVGDFWEVQTTSDFPGAPPSVRMEVASIDAGVALITGHISTNSTTSGFTFTSTTDIKSWLRISDSAAVRTETHTNTTFPMPVGDASVQQTDTETVYDPPCAQYKWPIVTGDTWTASCHTRTTTTSAAGPQTTESTTQTNVTALREETITVKAGTFDTLVLQMATDAGSVTTWFAPSACYQAKATASNYTQELVAFKCAKAGTSTPAPSTTSSTPAGSSTPTTSTTTATGTTTTTPSEAAGSGAKTPGPGVALVLAAVGAGLLLARKRS